LCQEEREEEEEEEKGSLTCFQLSFFAAALIALSKLCMETCAGKNLARTSAMRHPFARSLRSRVGRNWCSFMHLSQEKREEETGLDS